MNEEERRPFASVPGPSSELEAAWGPRGYEPWTPPDDPWTPPDAPQAPDGGGYVDPFAHLAVLLPSSAIVPDRKRRVPVAAIVAAVAFVAIAGGTAAALLGGGDDRPASRVTGAAPATTAAGSETGGDGDGSSPATASDDTTSDTVGPAVEGTTTSVPGAAATTGTGPAMTSVPAVGPAAAAELAKAEQFAREFVAVLERRDCKALWAMLSTPSREFINGFSEEDEPTAEDFFCAEMEDETTIPAITVRPPARATPTGAIVDLESEGEVEPLHLVLENGQWKIDLIGALDEGDVDDEDASSHTPAQADLQSALIAEKTWFTDDRRYTDDLAELRDIEPSIVWKRGIAPADAAGGEVYVALADDGSVVCLSARDADGTRHMVKDAASAYASETSYAEGGIPSTCDAAPLPKGW